MGLLLFRGEVDLDQPLRTLARVRESVREEESEREGERVKYCDVDKGVLSALNGDSSMPTR
jgi:hypothetical protein